MTPLLTTLLVLSAVMAGLGSVLLKLGASGNTSVLQFLNIQVLGAVLLYAGALALWLFGLAKINLTIVYPFTALTFAVVYCLSVVYLGERPSIQAFVGVLVILIGMWLIVSSE